MSVSSANISETLIKGVQQQITSELDNVGIFYRIFSRIKTHNSILQKINDKKYEDDNSLQDLFGIRIVVYFNEDIKVCKSVVEKLFIKVNEPIDSPDSSTFKPTRTNIVFRLDEKTTIDLNHILSNRLIDNTFELQLRTVFSEGWHEIEHDLRYKCKEEWESYNDHSRNLNGIVATLETCDWSINNLFSDLAYINYKDNNIAPMLRNKFKLRFLNQQLDDNLKDIFLKDKKLFKRLYRIDREEIMDTLLSMKRSLPLNFNNFIFICNYFNLNDERITQITPKSFYEFTQLKEKTTSVN